MLVSFFCWVLDCQPGLQKMTTLHGIVDHLSEYENPIRVMRSNVGNLVVNISKAVMERSAAHLKRKASQGIEPWTLSLQD